MPRIKAKKREYMIRDLAGWVAGKMHTCGFKQEDVAKELGISQQALSNRINPGKYKRGEIKDPFSYGDMLTLCKLFDVDGEEKEKLLTL